MSRMVKILTGENIDGLTNFKQFVSILPIKIFHFTTANYNDLFVSCHSRWQYMKHHRSVTASLHTSSSPSLNNIVTLICITTKTATRIFVLYFLASSAFTCAFILHLVVIIWLQCSHTCPTLFYNHVHSTA